MRNGKIRADVYDDCQDVPDPSALDPSQKNLLLLDDCILGKLNIAQAYYTRGRHSNCDTICIAPNYFRLPRRTIRENSNFIILFPQDVKISHISMLAIALVIYPFWNSNSFVTEYGTRNIIYNYRPHKYSNEWKVPPEFQPALFPYWYYINGIVQGSVHCSRITIIQRGVVR